MLGVMRFFLASCVVAFHLTASINYLGQFSVNCFYVISGFLITLILNKTYNFEGIRFAINRFLRLFPTYYFFIPIGLIIILLMPHANEFHVSWTGKFLSGDGFANAFIFPWALVGERHDPNPFGIFFGAYPFLVDGSRFRIITSSWSVGVELICYFFLWLVIARNWVISLGAVFLLSVYHAYVFYTTGSQSAVYVSVIAALLPFSIGALGFFFYERIAKPRGWLSFSSTTQYLLLLASIAVFFLNWIYFNKDQSNGWHPMHYYINNVIAVVIVILLVDSKPKGKIGYISKLFGDMSYPLFLCQYFGGYLAWAAMGFGSEKRGWDVFVLGYTISILMSLVSVYLIDRRLSKVRGRVRTEKRQ